MDWYPWYPTMFRTATRNMTPLQRGLYRDLIDEYMETREPLPDDDIALANICRCPVEVWLENSDRIRRKFISKDGLLFQAFCDENLDEQDKISESRSKVAKKAASTRWKHKVKPIMLDACSKHSSSIHQAMLGDATGQDTTEQKITPISPLEIDMAFQKVWNAYPGRGKDGAYGNGYKGPRQKAFQKFGSIYRNEPMKSRNDLIVAISTGCALYAGHLDRSGYPSKHMATWLNQSGWKEDYSGTGPQKVKVDHRANDENQKLLMELMEGAE